MSVAPRLGKRLYNVVLVSPQIPHNTGSIGRTCLAFGARLHLIGPYGFKLDDKSVKRAGLDYWKHVDLREYTSWKQFEETTWPSLENNAFFFSKFGTTSLLDVNFLSSSSNTKNDKLSSSSEESEHITLLFGSETHGLHKLIGTDFVNAHTTIYMPMLNHQHRSNDTPSFNLAASVAMGLWEAYRQDASSSKML